MIVVVFRSRLRADAGPEYAPVAERMLNLAKSMPGFISFRHYQADDGERLSLIEFEDEETLSAWRNHPDHLDVQKRGRAQFYAEYHIQVLSPVRAAEFRRPISA